MDLLSGMTVFARVVEEDSFARAAAALGLSRSAASKQVAWLEDRLGARLLNRTTRKISLTEVGRAYYERCLRILEEVENASQAVARLHDAPRIATTHRVACASPAYLARRGVPKTPEDLAGHACLEYSNLPTAGEWPFRRDGAVQRVKVSGPLRADNGDILRCAALAGLGVILSPVFIVADDLADGRLVPVLEDHADEGVPVWAVYPHNRHLSTKVRMFVDFLAERFAGEVR
ncbi:MAG: LysR family transcriptional regulator [Bauldia litoralis]